MNPDGWVDGEPPMSQDEKNLARFLDDLKRKCDEAIQHSEAMRAAWHEALSDKAAWSALPKSNAMPSRCPACQGQGRVTDLYTITGGTLNTPCPWCEGSGAVVLVRERRGVE